MQSVIFKLLALAAICLATPHGEKAEIEDLGSKLMVRDDGVEMTGTFVKYRSVETGPMANLQKRCRDGDINNDGDLPCCIQLGRNSYCYCC